MRRLIWRGICGGIRGFEAAPQRVNAAEAAFTNEIRGDQLFGKSCWLNTDAHTFPAQLK